MALCFLAEHILQARPYTVNTGIKEKGTKKYKYLNIFSLQYMYSTP
jgi:hypothetical protein